MPRKRSETETPPVVDPATYSRFVAGVQPTRIELGDVNASARPSTLQEVNVRVESNFTMGCMQRDTQASTFEIEARLHMQFLTEKGVEVGQFGCLYHLSYHSAQALDDTLLDQFTRRNAPVHVWPFMRELVLNLTQRFGWTGFVLPSFFIPASGETGESSGGQGDMSAQSADALAARKKAPARKPRGAKAEG